MMFNREVLDFFHYVEFLGIGKANRAFIVLISRSPNSISYKITHLVFSFKVSIRNLSVVEKLSNNKIYILINPMGSRYTEQAKICNQPSPIDNQTKFFKSNGLISSVKILIDNAELLLGIQYSNMDCVHSI